MAYRKLGRTSSQRKALLRDLVSDLVINERITTTVTRAKEVSKLADKLVTLGKKGDIHSRRQAASILRNELATVEETEEAIIVESVVQKLFNEIAPRFETRNGGYTRVLKTEPRRRSEEHTSELQSRGHLVCRLLLEKNNGRSSRVE